jgi:hypothetical protein
VLGAAPASLVPAALDFAACRQSVDRSFMGFGGLVGSDVLPLRMHDRLRQMVVAIEGLFSREIVNSTRVSA